MNTRKKIIEHHSIKLLATNFKFIALLKMAFKILEPNEVASLIGGGTDLAKFPKTFLLEYNKTFPSKYMFNLTD